MVTKQKTEWLMAKIISSKIKTKERKHPPTDKSNEIEKEHKLLNQVMLWASVFFALFIVISLVYAVVYSVFRTPL